MNSYTQNNVPQSVYFHTSQTDAHTWSRAQPTVPVLQTDRITTQRLTDSFVVWSEANPLTLHTFMCIQQGAYVLHSTTQTCLVLLILNNNLNFICFNNTQTDINRVYLWHNRNRMWFNPCRLTVYCIFIIIHWYALMMVASMTETFWFLLTCSRLHFTTVLSLVYLYYNLMHRFRIILKILTFLRN